MKETKKKKVVEYLNKDLNNKRKAILIFSLMLILVVGLLVTASYFRNFGEIKLSTNDKSIFNIDDLKIGNLKYGDNVSTVVKNFGEAKEEKVEMIGSYNYKIMNYDGATLYLKEFYDTFKLCKVEITSRKYEISREIKIGSKITSVYNDFKIENSTGAYLYGNYTNKSLKDNSIKDNIYFGVRSKENVLYINRDEVIDGIHTNIAKLNIEYSNGVVKKITWSYDVE